MKSISGEQNIKTLSKHRPRWIYYFLLTLFLKYYLFGVYLKSAADFI